MDLQRHSDTNGEIEIDDPALGYQSLCFGLMEDLTLGAVELVDCEYGQSECETVVQVM